MNLLRKAQESHFCVNLRQRYPKFVEYFFCSRKKTSMIDPSLGNNFSIAISSCQPDQSSLQAIQHKKRCKVMMNNWKLYKCVICLFITVFLLSNAWLWGSYSNYSTVDLKTVSFSICIWSLHSSSPKKTKCSRIWICLTLWHDYPP